MSMPGRPLHIASSQPPTQSPLFEEASVKARNPKKPAYEPPNTGKAIRLTVPDFSDPGRRPTCLEVDFPIEQINALSQLEGNAGKPIYQMSKWWARRRPSVFRSLLIAAAVEAPDDPNHAAKHVWDHYFCNHQKAGHFKKLKVLDSFVGGGTTVVEGSRLGFDVTGIDLNPIAWFVTKNAVAGSDPEQVKALFDHVEAEVKPLVQPFYTTSCSRGHKGRWIDVNKEQTAQGEGEVRPEAVMPEGFDAIDLPPHERKHYRWDGPEVIYTFWAKHGPCRGRQGKPCGHRTPIFKTPVIAEKKLTTKFIALTCPHCGHGFRAELGETRMAPGTERVVVENEPPFTELSQLFAQMLKDYGSGPAHEKRQRIQDLLGRVDNEPGLRCPSCAQFSGERVKRILNRHARPGVSASGIKKSDFEIQSGPVYMYLLVCPKWLEGDPDSLDGREFGGWAGAAPEATAAWHKVRLSTLAMVEIRGRVKLEEDEQASQIEDESAEGEADTAAEAEHADESQDAERKKYGPPATVALNDGTVIHTRLGTVPKKSTFKCPSCGTIQDVLESVVATGHTAPVAPYAIQCHCPQCAVEGFNYNGRYFKTPDAHDVGRLNQAEREWVARHEADLKGFFPDSPLVPAYMTHKLNGGIPNWGYTHWWKMFNPRQLLVHANLLRAIDESARGDWPLDVAEQVLGAFQQYLRNQNMFCFWDISRDCMAPFLSNANYHPKAQVVENCVFPTLGRGNWSSSVATVTAGLEWCIRPWEAAFDPSESTAKRSVRVLTGDRLEHDTAEVHCGSSSDLAAFHIGTADLAITDPPFGDNLFYADLADFFYVWLRIPLLNWYTGLPERRYFEPARSPHALEAIQNELEHPDDREDCEREPLVEAKHLGAIRQRSGDSTIEAGDPNPLYRREPAAAFYCDTLATCWAEANRVTKPGGLLAFTFHHSKDAPWVDVLESLFRSGWVLVATYPIRSDETKGAGQFGSRKIEYDIVHVCRKRLAEPQPVAWAKMRRWVKEEGARYKNLLERTHGDHIPVADLQIILIGKSLEFYSRHYGQVLTGDGQVLDVGEALLGVIQLLNDLMQEGTDAVLRPPDEAEPLTRTVLSLFAERDSLTWDELGKTMRGTAIPPDLLIAKGWVRRHGQRVLVAPITERYQALTQPGRTRKAVLKADLDQAHFLIGAVMGGKDITAELSDATWSPKLSVNAILAWLAQTHQEPTVRDAAGVAARLLTTWRARPERPKTEQLSLFTRLEQQSEG